MVDAERLGVAICILLFLGGSYVAAVYTFASEYLVVATIVYVVLAVALLLRVIS